MQRSIGALLISLLSLPALAASAGPFDFVPAGGDVRAALTAGDFRRALDAFDRELGPTAFAKSANGRATRNFILLKNGLPYFAIASLVLEVKPTSLDPRLLNLWSTELRGNDLVKSGAILTKGPWARIVDNTPVRLNLKSKADVAKAFARVKAIPAQKLDERTRVLWQIANAAPQVGDTESALRALDQLRSSGQTLIKSDLISLTAARVLYQRDDLDGAVHALDEIPKSSNLWVEALEERTWASVRRDDFDKALGGITTLLSPALDPLVGPEPFFLSNLVSLKTCDYPRLFKTSDTFKARHRDRLAQMQSLATTGQSPSSNEILEKLDRAGLSVESLGNLVARVPRAALRDHALRVAVDSRRELIKEAKLAGELKDERSSLFAAKGAENFRKVEIARLRQLATVEVKEYRTMLNKMHILEAEVIERMNLDDNLKGKRGHLAKVKDEGDVLVFPYNSDEVWLDELDNYKARVKDCPTLKGAGL